jgi:CRISPR-associated endoribonuclease Cas6
MVLTDNAQSERLDGTKRFMMRLSITFRPLRKILIPPFSAKVSKTILYRISELYKRASDVSTHFKPVAVTPIYRGDQALFKVKGSRTYMMLEEGGNYTFSASLITNEATTLDKLVSLESPIVDGVYGSSISIEYINIEVRDFESFGFRKPSAIKISFETPVLLQLPSKRRYMSGRHFLFPIPSLLIGSLIEYWNRHCAASQIVKNPYYLTVYSNYVLREADFEIRPVTVVYDESRLIRGFVGWVLYDLRTARNTRSLRTILGLLDYAQYVGVGRSRATGFGQLKLKSYY